jgi:hypothetical protein
MSLIQIKSQKCFSSQITAIFKAETTSFVNLVSSNDRGSLIFFTCNSKVVYMLSVRKQKIKGSLPLKSNPQPD